MSIQMTIFSGSVETTLILDDFWINTIAAFNGTKLSNCLCKTVSYVDNFKVSISLEENHLTKFPFFKNSVRFWRINWNSCIETTVDLANFDYKQDIFLILVVSMVNVCIGHINWKELWKNKSFGSNSELRNKQ